METSLKNELLKAIGFFIILASCSSQQQEQDCYDDYCHPNSGLIDSLNSELPPGSEVMGEYEYPLVEQYNSGEAIADDKQEADSSSDEVVVKERGIVTNDLGKENLKEFYIEVEQEPELESENIAPTAVETDLSDEESEESDSSETVGLAEEDDNNTDNDEGEEVVVPKYQAYFEPEDVSIALVKACGYCHEFVKDFDQVQNKSEKMLERINLPVSSRFFMPTANHSWPETEDGQLVITYLEGISSVED